MQNNHLKHSCNSRFECLARAWGPTGATHRLQQSEEAGLVWLTVGSSNSASDTEWLEPYRRPPIYSVWG